MEGRGKSDMTERKKRLMEWARSPKCTNVRPNFEVCRGQDCSRCGWNKEFRKQIVAGGMHEIRLGIMGYRTPKQMEGQA